MNDVLVDKRVLVVDDQATPRMLVASSLEHCGVRVEQAEDALQALDVARDAAFDAFILDINMPGVSGIELCRNLRDLPRYRYAPVIFVTGMAPTEMLQWALDAGGDDFIRKPVQSVVLRARLRSLLERASYLHELELLNSTLQRYVSPRTEEMARTHAATGLLLPARREEVCVLFSDARGLTEMDEDLDPREVVRLLNEHLGAQAGLVQHHEGYVDKFLGDGLLAIFDGPDRVVRCCLCALDIVEQTGQWPQELAIERQGIGVHAGTAVIGNLGSSSRLDYSFVGTTVNLAARLSSLASHASVVVSSAVRDALLADDRLAFVNQRHARLRGIPGPISVFDLARGNASGAAK